jgi:hypothetical protein
MANQSQGNWWWLCSTRQHLQQGVTSQQVTLQQQQRWQLLVQGSVAFVCLLHPRLVHCLVALLCSNLQRL